MIFITIIISKYFIKLVLVQYDVKHLGRTLSQLFSGHKLHVDVPRLRLVMVMVMVMVVMVMVMVMVMVVMVTKTYLPSRLD